MGPRYNSVTGANRKCHLPDRWHDPGTNERLVPASRMLGASPKNEDHERQRRGRVQGPQDQLLHQQSPPIRCRAVGLRSEPRLADTSKSIGRRSRSLEGSRESSSS